jgi:microcystin-dependent protein
MDPFIGEIRMFGGNFAPVGWATCDGQLLPIAQYTALFSLIGTIYGGDGQTTFALPDLRGRLPMHIGTGLSIGQAGGSETVALTAANLPAGEQCCALCGRPGWQRDVGRGHRRSRREPAAR